MAEYLSPAVYMEEIASGNKPIQAAGTSVGAFVGIAEKGPIGEAVFIKNFAEFNRVFGTYVDAGYLAFAVKAFFDEGGTRCHVVRTCHYDQDVPLATATYRLFKSGGGATDSITIHAASPGTWGNNLTVEITHVGADLFSIDVCYRGAPVENFPDLSMDNMNKRYAAAVVSSEAEWIRVEVLGAARPDATSGHERLDSTVGLNGHDGSDGLTGIVAEDFTGWGTVDNGLLAFDKVDEIRIVAMPDATDDAHVGGMAYCENRGDCFYVADPPEIAASGTDTVINFKTSQGLYAGAPAMNSKYGALYTPWIRVFDPRSGTGIPIPPSGAVLGRYAATDSARGVHKAPAGTEDGRLRSVMGLGAEFTKADQERLNPKGINVIRKFPGVGNVIWGARTVSSDPEWRYLNVRRLFLQLETSILNDTKWVVFEPNTPALWKSITRNVTAFLKTKWMEGALVGATQEEAFYVKCNEETNPQESVDLGRVVTEIGVAPSKPAEFVVFRISQYSGGAEASE